MFKRLDLAIVNRSFWPGNQVIGEALLQFAEANSKHHCVGIFTQYTGNLRSKLKQEARGENIRVRNSKAFTDSSSGILFRALESAFFMVWVLFYLLWDRPRKVYVATDPPILVPFVVFLYSKFFRAEYFYHLQDIHPEAADIVLPVSPVLKRSLTYLDNLTLGSAAGIVTISEDMRTYLIQRSATSVPVYLLDNPSLKVEVVEQSLKNKDIVFCGNAGRLQLIPLLLEGIRRYLDNGGELSFTFIGAGVYSTEIAKLAKQFDEVSYHGYLPADQAANIVSEHKWALLPIDDQVTRYAFPSKSSSYVLSGCNIIAICSEGTSVANWIREFNTGLVCEPDTTSIVQCFQKLERHEIENSIPSEALFERLQINTFSDRLSKICGLKPNQ